MGAAVAWPAAASLPGAHSWSAVRHLDSAAGLPPPPPPPLCCSKFAEGVGIKFFLPEDKFG